MLREVAAALKAGQVRVSAQDSGCYGRDWVQLAARSAGQERGGYVLLSAEEALQVARALIEAAGAVAQSAGIVGVMGEEARNAATTADHR